MPTAKAVQAASQLGILADAKLKLRELYELRDDEHYQSTLEGRPVRKEVEVFIAECERALDAVSLELGIRASLAQAPRDDVQADFWA